LTIVSDGAGAIWQGLGNFALPASDIVGSRSLWRCIDKPWIAEHANWVFEVHQSRLSRANLLHHLLG
jgi:hypothetical protein